MVPRLITRASSSQPAIRLVEAGQHGAVEIQHAKQRIPVQQRDHEFGTRRRIAGDVAGKRLDVRDQD